MTDAHAKAIRAVSESVPTIRTGTVTTDYGDPNTGTYVSLDNDPTSTPVRALSGQYLAAGTRVLLAAYPPRGLAILNTLSTRAPQGGAWQFITSGTAQPFNESLIPIGAKAITFKLQAGGGGSGGTAATAAPAAGSQGTVTVSGGGAGGDMVEVTVYLDGTQWPLTYTVGGGGAGGAAGNTIGIKGGNTVLAFTRLGVLITETAQGGLGGNGGGAASTPFEVKGGAFSGALSGISATGALVYPGQPGYAGFFYSGVGGASTTPGAAALMGWGGDGGESPLGARQFSNAVATFRDLRGQGLPTAGQRYGGGAAGGFAATGQAATAGAAGAAGVIAWQPLF